MTYNERLALEWLNTVSDMCSWEVAPDCEGTVEQRVESALINTQDAYAEGVITIVEQPAYLRNHACILDDPQALAALPPLPVYG